jgi:flagellum-specific peptidoglycan hydrolase FlgJ
MGSGPLETGDGNGRLKAALSTAFGVEASWGGASLDKGTV